MIEIYPSTLITLQHIGVRTHYGLVYTLFYCDYERLRDLTIEKS